MLTDAQIEKVFQALTAKQRSWIINGMAAKQGYSGSSPKGAFKALTAKQQKFVVDMAKKRGLTGAGFGSFFKKAAKAGIKAGVPVLKKVAQDQAEKQLKKQVEKMLKGKGLLLPGQRI